MKKSDWIIALATCAYSYLFYQQLAGINFFVFSVLITFLLGILNKDAVRNKMWVLFAVSSMLSSYFIMWHNSSLAIWANLFSLLLLSAYSIDRRSSVILNGFYSMYSIGGSYIFLILNIIKRSEKKDNTEKSSDTKKGIKFLVISGMIILVLIFFFIYKNVNPLFEKYTEKINLDFISGLWLLFSIGGFFIVYGLFKPQRIRFLDEWENNLPLQLTDTGKTTKKFEKLSGSILFALLNLMLVFINILDVIFLYGGDKLPEGITHSQFVHNGVGMLILSIILGVSIILFMFRNALNFDKENKTLKFLVSLWILQNIMMICSTSLRNYMYILDYSMTYKRIGVFVYLILTVIGLVTTLIKIHYKKSNWYLVKTNALCGILFLCASSGINWDTAICEFNTGKKMDKLQELDKKYLLSLSDEAIPYLQFLKNKPGFDTDSAKKDWYRGAESFDSYSRVNDYMNNSDETDLKTYRFLKKVNKYPGWQSWNHRNDNILALLNHLNADGKIETLSIKNELLDTLDLLTAFNNARQVDLSNSHGQSLLFLGSFRKIESLQLDAFGVKNLSEIPALTTLKELDLSNNPLQNLKQLDKFTALKKLSLSENSVLTLGGVPENTSIISLELNSCSGINDLGGLKNFKNLSELDLSNAPVFENFPLLPTIVSLSLDNQQTYCNQNLSKIPVLENLKSLSLMNNEKIRLINLLHYDTRTKVYSLRFPKLETLWLNNNALDDVSTLANYNTIRVLHLHNNRLANTGFLLDFENLEELDLSYNSLDSLLFNEKQNSIRKLELDGNTYLNNYSALKQLNKLEVLDVSNSRFISLGNLSCQGSLKELNIANTRLTTLSGLQAFTSLESLTVSELKENEISILSQLKKLNTLNILNSSLLSNETKKKLKEQLPHTKIELL